MILILWKSTTQHRPLSTFLTNKNKKSKSSSLIIANCCNILLDKKKLRRKSFPTLSRTKYKKKRSFKTMKAKETESSPVWNTKLRVKVLKKLNGDSLRQSSMSESREWWKSSKNFKPEFKDSKQQWNSFMKRLIKTWRTSTGKKLRPLFKVCLNNWRLNSKSTLANCSNKFQEFWTKEYLFTIKNWR